MPVKIIIMVHKVDSMSDEEFRHYWSIEHPKIWLNVPIVKEKVMQYSQFHVDRAVTDQLKAQGHPVSPFDGLVTMVGASFEDLQSIFEDAEYKRLVVPDEEKFIKRDQAVLMLGEELEKQSNYRPLPGVLS